MANQINNAQAESTGVELNNNNVGEIPGSNKSETPQQPTSSGSDVEKQQIAENEPEKDWIVKFDGNDDPDNPRSMTTKRKWLITMVVAFSSLCVYVLGFTRTIRALQD